MNKFIPYIIIVLLSFAIGYWAGSGTSPIIPEPVTRYVAPGKLPFSVPELRATPDTRFIIGARTDTVTVKPETVYVPVDMDPYNLASPNPITLTSRQVHYRYFDTADQRYKVDLFDIPAQRWHLRAYADLFAWDILNQPVFLPGLRAEAGYRRLTVQAGTYLNTTNQQPIIMAGVSYRFGGH